MRWVVLAILLLFNSFQLSGQTAIGKEFWFTYPHNRTAGGDASWRNIVVPAFPEQSGQIVVEIPGLGYKKTWLTGGFQIGGPNDNAFSLILGALDSIFVNPFMGLNEGRDTISVHVKSTLDVLVYAASYNDDLLRDHGDLAQILPITSLGNEYYVMSHNEFPVHFYSQATIVATLDGTAIDIIPTADTRTINAGEKATIYLDRGDRYQIQSKEDLTGTYIGLNHEESSGCNRFAVFAGSLVSTVGDRTYPGHMFKQMLPLSMWSKSYSLLPFGDSPNDYLVKLVAFENNTEIFIDGVKQEEKLKYGESLTFTFNQPTKITSNKPIQVAQFFMGLNNKNNTKYDPFMLMATGDEHMDRFTRWHGLNYNIELEDGFPISVIKRPPVGSRSILIRTEARKGFFHQASRFGRHMTEFLPDPQFSYSNFQLDSKYDSLFFGGNGAILNAFMYSSRYENVNIGFRGNVSFATLDDVEIIVTPEQEVSSPIICLSDYLTFQPHFYGIEGYNPRFDTYRWDFGDGATTSGDSVTHQFNKPGIFEVSLMPSKRSSLCLLKGSTSVTVTVIDTNIEKIEGPTTVCPNLEEAEYTAKGDSLLEYSWSVSGGVISKVSDDKVVVNWGESNPEAFVQAIATNPYGCAADTLVFPVKINERLEPELPEGTTEICFYQAEQVYQAIFSPSSIYNWQIENGSIVSGQGTHEVVVRWDAVGSGKIGFTESSSTSTDVCSGDSPMLEVTIYDDIRIVPTIGDVQCFGENDGWISLEISGGKAPYQLLWEDGSEDDVRSNLIAGYYSVIVTDSIGCEFSLEMEVKEPEELTGSIEISDVKCFGEANGEASISIFGGTAPYFVYWNGESTPGMETIEGLGKGMYSVKVIDSQACEFTLEFEVLQPDVLMAITTDSPTCSGENTGTILVEASGGTRPYFYRWNTSPPQEAQLIRGLPAGKYSVTVTDANGCMFTFEDEEIREKYPLVQLPNAFSPNNDGRNDTFLAVTDCSADFQMKIFSQWGEIVFYSKDIANGWDGTYLGEEVPEGTYTYIVSYSGEVNGVSYQESVRGKVRVFR